MPRVVCPLCRIGFEAIISRDNVALNCVACGVAFNAAEFLSKTEFSAGGERRPSNANASRSDCGTIALGNQIRPIEPPPPPIFAEPAAIGTRTGGLPFMTETGDHISPPLEKEMGRLGVGSPLPPLAPLIQGVEIKLAPPQLPDKLLSEATPENSPIPAARSEAKTKKASRRPLLEGTFGPYEIDSEIARGGVGAVFRAREIATGKQVALKVLLDGDDAGEADRERFRHECETAKALSLPGMVQVYAVGECEQRPYMAMELVEGRSLDKLIPEKSLSVNDCLVLMKSVAETIGALHEAGYVHRDIKPGNILIDAFGSPKVADFGLVKSVDEITRLTASGLVCGTPAYMAPEQARGDGKAVDPRSDVWALGAVLYEMLTATPPFQADNALRLMLKITKEQPRPPRVLNLKVPEDVHYIVMKCLEKNPVRRYPTARALAADIIRFLNGEPLEAPQQPKFQKFLASAVQHRRPLVAVCGGIAAIVLVAVIARVVLAPREAGPLVERGYQTLNDKSLKLNECLERATQFFSDAILLDGKNAKAHLGLGLCLGRRAISTDVNNPMVTDAKRMADAIAETTQASDLDPVMRAESHAQLARFKMWMKQSSDEAKEWEKAVELAPNNLKYREALGMAYWNAGAQTKSGAYYKRAVTEFQNILNAEPTYPKLREYIKQLQERFLTQQPSVPTVAARIRRS